MMKKMVIKVESFDETMRCWDDLAQLIDQGKEIPETCVRSFEDPEDLLALFTPARRELLAEVQARPGSIKDMALRLHRRPNEVKQDLRALAQADILSVSKGWIRLVAEEIVFEPISQTAAPS